MEHMTPTVLFQIVGFSLLIIAAFAVWGFAPDLIGRYVRVRSARVLSSGEAEQHAEDSDENDEESRISSAETNSETAEIQQWIAENRDDIFHSGENTAIARLIAAGAIKLTEGVKLGTGKRSGDAYSKRSREIQAIVKELQDRYPQRTDEQREQREALELEPRR